MRSLRRRVDDLDEIFAEEVRPIFHSIFKTELISENYAIPLRGSKVPGFLLYVLYDAPSQPQQLQPQERVSSKVF